MRFPLTPAGQDGFELVGVQFDPAIDKERKIINNFTVEHIDWCSE
jgi:hypothetical protein